MNLSHCVLLAALTLDANNEVIFALTLYGLVHQDAAALEAADRVFAYTRRPKA